MLTDWTTNIPKSFNHINTLIEKAKKAIIQQEQVKGGGDIYNRENPR